MIARVQRRGEAVDEYMIAKYALCQDLKITFSETKEYIVAGLRSREAGDLLLARQHAELEDLVQDISQYERVEAVRKGWNDSKWGGARNDSAKQFGQVKNDRDIANPTQPKTPTADEPKERVMERNKIVRKCFRCSQEGHISPNCPAVECYKCREWGHMASRCPGKRELNLLVQKRLASSAFFQRVVLNESCLIEGLIDTGAAVCVIKERCVRKFGLPMCPWREVLTGFGENAGTETIGRVIVSVRIGSARVEDLDCLVVSDKVRGPELIIGASFLSNSRVKWCVNGGVVCVEASEDPLESVQPLEEDASIAFIQESCEVDDENIKVGEGLSAEGKEMVRECIRSNRDCFSENLYEQALTIQKECSENIELTAEVARSASEILESRSECNENIATIAVLTSEVLTDEIATLRSTLCEARRTLAVRTTTTELALAGATRKSLHPAKRVLLPTTKFVLFVLGILGVVLMGIVCPNGSLVPKEWRTQIEGQQPVVNGSCNVRQYRVMMTTSLRRTADPTKLHSAYRNGWWSVFHIGSFIAPQATWKPKQRHHAGRGSNVANGGRSSKTPRKRTKSRFRRRIVFKRNRRRTKYSAESHSGWQGIC